MPQTFDRRRDHAVFGAFWMLGCAGCFVAVLSGRAPNAAFAMACIAFGCAAFLLGAWHLWQGRSRSVEAPLARWPYPQGASDPSFRGHVAAARVRGVRNAALSALVTLLLVGGGALLDGPAGGILAIVGGLAAALVVAFAQWAVRRFEPAVVVLSPTLARVNGDERLLSMGPSHLDRARFDGGSQELVLEHGRIFSPEDGWRDGAVVRLPVPPGHEVDAERVAAHLNALAAAAPKAPRG